VSRHDADEAAEDTGGPVSVGDDQLPEDLRPSEDNPLAQPAGDDVPADVLTQNVGPEGSGGGSEDAATGGDGASSDASSVEASSETEAPHEADERA
jgi:hypothetical protein